MRPIAPQIRARRARSASCSIDSRRNGCPTQWTDIRYALRSMNVLGPTRSAMTCAPISSTRSKSTRCRLLQIPTAAQCSFSLSPLSICGPLCSPAWPWFGKVAMYRLRSRQAQRLDDIGCGTAGANGARQRHQRTSAQLQLAPPRWTEGPWAGGYLTWSLIGAPPRRRLDSQTPE
jgi:hypothetical protein